MMKRLIAILAVAAALAACTPGASPSVQAPAVSSPSSAPGVESSPSGDAGSSGEASASPS